MRGELVNENALALILCIVSKEEMSRDAALKAIGIKAVTNNCGTKEKVYLLKESDLEDIKRLYYEEYKTFTQIAKIYQVSVGTLSNYMKNHDLQARPSGWGYYNNHQRKYKE